MDGEVFVEVVDGAEADDEDLDFDVRKERNLRFENIKIMILYNKKSLQCAP